MDSVRRGRVKRARRRRQPRGMCSRRGGEAAMTNRLGKTGKALETKDVLPVLIGQIKIRRRRKHTAMWLHEGSRNTRSRDEDLSIKEDYYMETPPITCVFSRRLFVWSAGKAGCCGAGTILLPIVGLLGLV